MALGGGEVDHATARQQVQPAPVVEVVAFDERTDRLGVVAGRAAQLVEVDLDVEVSGVGQHRAVLHAREVLAAEDRARARHGDEHITARGRRERGHHLEAVHAGLQRSHRVHLAHDHGRAGPARACRDALARPAVAEDDERVPGEQ